MYEVEYPSRLFGEAVEALMRLPGVGRKGAQRYLLHMLGRSEGDRRLFAEALRACLMEMGHCPRCHGFSDDGSLCGHCVDAGRDGGLLCVVADVRDAMALERIGQFRGGYFILGQLISPMSGVGPDDLPVEKLVSRIGEGVHEVILALDTTMDGEATAFYLRRCLEPLGVVLSVPARGIAFGDSIEQTDEVTLSKAMQHRMVLEPLDRSSVSRPGIAIATTNGVRR